MMMKTITRFGLLSFLNVLLLTVESDLAFGQTSIDVNQSVFAETETAEWVATIRELTSQTNIVWTLSWNQTVLNRGQQRTDREQPDTLKIPLEMPNLNSKEPMKLVMTLKVPVSQKEGDSAKEGSEAGTKTFQFALLVVASDLFGNRQAWLKSKNIAVFDRNDKTLGAFRQASIPFTKINSLDDFVAEADSLVIIAEGTDWDRRPALKEKLNQFLAVGANVVVLSPIQFKVTIAPSESTEFRGGTTRLPDFLNRYKLKIPEVSRRFSIRDGSDGMEIESKPESKPELQNAWNWLLFTNQQAERTSHLLILGHPVIESWSDSPHGKLIVLDLLEYLEQQLAHSQSEGN